MLDPGAHVVRAEDALLDEKRHDRHLHDLVVGEGGVFQVRLERVAMGRVRAVSAVPVGMAVLVHRSAEGFAPAHVVSPGAGSSQCS